MKTATIDLTNCKYVYELHQRIEKALGFPDYYGKNLDALFDCLTDIRREQELVLLNWHAFSYTMKDYAEKTLYVFRCVCDENPHLTVTLHP